MDKLKQEIGKKAASLIKDGMVVGIGTGSTADCFIDALIENKLKVSVTATSMHSLKRAASGGLTVVDIDRLETIDITIDGADEIDPQKRLIKGHGGALLREKIVANASSEMVVIADESKLVENLGAFGLPVEIVPFAHQTTIKNLGYDAKLRMDGDEPFITDGGNLIADLTFSEKVESPESLHSQIINIPGVIETGFFFNLAKKIIIGYKNGEVKIL